MLKPYYETEYTTLYHGDCLEILPQLDKVDLVLTDPPYIQEFHSRGMAKDRPKYKEMKEYGSSKTLDYSALVDILKDKIKEKNMFFFCDKETKHNLISWSIKNKWGYKELCFCKTSPAPFTNNQWLPDVEFGLHIFKNLKVRGSYETKKSWSVLVNLQAKNINHPSPKKTSEIQRVLSNISEENQVVLDVFAGSGSTAVACESLKRKCILIEKEEKYCNVIVNRLSQQYLF